jgi:uncharacterized protein YjbI with pentapeptide repeats
MAGVYLDIADLYGANLESSDMGGVAANLACFQNAVLIGANLSGARCWGANFSGAVLIRSRLTQADLAEADLTGALLDEVEIGTFSVRGALTDGIHPKETQRELAAIAKKQAEDYNRQFKKLRSNPP